MKQIKRIRVNPRHPSSWTKGRFDPQKVDATSEQDINAHKKMDNAIALMELEKRRRGGE
jgi:hypothetical protein